MKMLDGLRRAKREMDRDRETGAWDTHIHAFEDYSQMLRDIADGRKKDADLDLAALFRAACKRLPCNCLNLGNVIDGHSDERLEERCRRVSALCHDSWLRGGQLHALAKIPKQPLHDGFYISELAIELMGKLKENDAILYGAVCEMINILEGDLS